MAHLGMVCAANVCMLISEPTCIVIGIFRNGILQLPVHILIVDEGFIGMSDHLKADSQAQLQERKEV